MYVKIKLGKLKKMQKALKSVSKISDILMAPADYDEHGNSSYKADRPLKEIIDVLYFDGFIDTRNFIPKAPEKELQVITR